MMKLMWGGWFYGLAAAFVAGGAGAIGTGFAQVIIDPAHADVLHLLALMGTSFVITGVLTAAGFLAKSPLPQVETATTTTSVQPQGEGVKITSKTTTTQESQ